MCTGSRFLCKIHLLFKYFPKPLCDFFTTTLVQMISVRQAVGILHCDRTVVVVDKGYAVFAAGFLLAFWMDNVKFKQVPEEK